MQTSAHTQAIDPHSRTGRDGLPYFRLPEPGHPIFYLAVFFNAQAEVKALDALTSDVYIGGKVARNEAMGMALAGAGGHLRMEVRRLAREVVREGLLPFAWVGTKALAGLEEVAPVLHLEPGFRFIPHVVNDNREKIGGAA